MIIMKLLAMTGLVLFILVACSGGNEGKGPVTASLSTLVTGFAPPALRSSSARSRACAETDPDPFYNFLRCQPHFLRSYLTQIGYFISEAYDFADEIEPTLASAADGTSGSLNLEAGETVQWTKTNASTFSFSILKDGTLRAKITYDAGNVVVVLDGQLISDARARGIGTVRLDVTYRSNAEWRASAFLAGITCNPSDLNSPERMRFEVELAGGLWKAKVMTYHPRRSQDTCSTTPTDSTAMNVFTDYVGDEKATRASVYLMGREVSSLTSMANYELKKFCSNYTTFCGGGSTVYAADIPLCLTSSGASPQFGNDCATISPAVSSAGYLDSNLWLLPSAFHSVEAPVLTR